jgi:4-aminobutyrate aminotransferase-like enzyme
MIIDDEVFTGFGKTGKFFAIEHMAVKPDIICMGKSMGGGMPIGAISAAKDIINPWELSSRGSLGSFAGHPISSAASLTLIHVLKGEKIIEKVNKKGEYIKNALKDILVENNMIGDVRGIGLIIGMELVEDANTKKPETEKVEKIVEMALKYGLLLGKSGSYGNVLQITPSLTINMKQIDKGLEILNDTIKKIIN